MTQYVAIDIGCLECGIGTTLIGVFATEKEAQDASEAYMKETGITHRMSDHAISIFDSSHSWINGSKNELQK